jgi:hypothetical protein
MEPRFLLWVLKPKSSQSSGCTHINHTSRKSLNKSCLPARKLMVTAFCDRKGVLMVEFMQQGTTIMPEMCRETLKNCVGPAIQNKRRGMLTCGAMLLRDSARPHTAARWSISTGSCLTILFTTLLSLRATTTCLLVPTGRIGRSQQHFNIMRSWWKVSKRGWDHTKQTSLTQETPDTRSASVPVVTTLRSSLSMSVTDRNYK